jgi:hypothetical protein
MSDAAVIQLVVLLSIAGWVGLYARRAWVVWRDLRGDRIVTCPETGKPAAVRIDIGHAIGTLNGSDMLRLQSCSRWPERGPCDEPCLADAQQYESAASRIVYAWAQNKACTFCRRPLVESEITGRHVALLDADGITREWLDISAERLRDALVGQRPVCWDCHIAESFRRGHADLVVDRDFRGRIGHGRAGQRRV